ncbi:GntP family permease [Corynebacterium camporealensis]|uniref:GntP family permease n=1 Tax=Corynebacterium camporealensis TaxID=161896 RepID=UPI000D20F54D|nr:hypothetical protein [Corynebacterium camporealensis]AVH88940.1 GntP family permease [Corynebacterium camporealensis]
MGLGAVLSIPVMAAAYAYSVWIGRTIITPECEAVEDLDIEAAYDELKASYAHLPSTALSLAPILVPIVAMATGSIASALGYDGVLTFIGTPMIALAIGFLCAVLLLMDTHMMDSFYGFVEEGLRTVGPIILITAAGGVLGRVISSTDVVNFISDNATHLAGLGLFFPFLIAVLFKTAQAPQQSPWSPPPTWPPHCCRRWGCRLPCRSGWRVMAICAGSLVVSHANDSHFWVVTNLSKMTAAQAYRSQTVVTGIMGCTAMLFIWLLGLIIV